MRYSKSCSGLKSFFELRNILSERMAIAYIIEETILLFLSVFQINYFLGIGIINKQIAFFQNPVFVSNVICFFITLSTLIIIYLGIALRDKTVWFIHHNFSRLLLGTPKLKLRFTTRRRAAFFIVEILYTVVLALAIFFYLDPDINLLPLSTPKYFNYIGFAILAIIGYAIFSQTKEFREGVYGPTPLQKRVRLGKYPLKRITTPRSGYVRIAPKESKKRHN
ncbi:MAG: hypothetical protein NTY48_02890 [Candidatus Diapherotrites archaeon]|nr:hypothetical protein [Candidatus Diapherotrites archaeon]